MKINYSFLYLGSKLKRALLFSGINNLKMNTLRRIFVKSIIIRNIHTDFQLKSKLYEPDYLEALKPKIPLYDTLNIQLRGYDYAVLESYQKFVHNMARNLEINVEECWATPAQEMKVTTLKPKSEVVNAQYNLKIYERTVQVTDVMSTQLPILLRALEASTPIGVTVNVVKHEDCHEEIRYVPDNELKVLKDELDHLGGPLKKK